MKDYKNYESKSLPKLKIPPGRAKISSYHNNYNIFFDKNQGKIFFQKVYYNSNFHLLCLPFSL